MSAQVGDMCLKFFGMECSRRVLIRCLNASDVHVELH